MASCKAIQRSNRIFLNFDSIIDARKFRAYGPGTHSFKETEMLRTAAAAKDLALGLSPWIPRHRSYGLDSVTTEELGRAIGGADPQATLLAHEVEIDSRGTTDRARLRLTWNEHGQAAGLPPSAFAKGTSSQLAPRGIVSAFGCHTYETRFFDQIQPTVDDLKLSERKFMAQDREVPDVVRRLTKTYVRNQPALVKVWEAMPMTLCHGDTHLGNTFSNPDGTAGIYDWQVFHKMNGLRDVAYFLMHSVPTGLRRNDEKQLLERYLARLADEGAGSEAPTLAEAFDTYRLLTIDGWIIIVFTLAAGGMQPDDRMEVTAVRAINTLVDLDVEHALQAAL